MKHPPICPCAARIGMSFQSFKAVYPLNRENLALAQMIVLKRSGNDAMARGTEALDRVGMLAHKAMKFQGNCPEGSSSGWPLQERCAWIRLPCYSMNPLRRSTQKMINDVLDVMVELAQKA